MQWEIAGAGQKASETHRRLKSPRPLLPLKRRSRKIFTANFGSHQELLRSDARRGRLRSQNVSLRWSMMPSSTEQLVRKAMILILPPH